MEVETRDVEVEVVTTETQQSVTITLTEGEARGLYRETDNNPVGSYLWSLRVTLESLGIHNWTA